VLETLTFSDEFEDGNGSTDDEDDEDASGRIAARMEQKAERVVLLC